ncbi:response regulator [Kitasatospora sp. NPDC057223]|uniref:response regulator n=1 Tax=Kitasatospora sp. NPDC057223 TaxID=3346055 RepID=UPI00364011EF
MTTRVPGRPYRVLLVEDDPADAMLITEALEEKAQREIVRVVNGEAALTYLRAAENPVPDLIVLDLNMPRMDGRELLDVIKVDEDLKSIPVVVLTTSAAPHDVSGAYRRYANAYVTKPVGLDEFTQAVQSIDSFYLDTAISPND